VAIHKLDPSKLIAFRCQATGSVFRSRLVARNQGLQHLHKLLQTRGSVKWLPCRCNTKRNGLKKRSPYMRDDVLNKP